MNTVRAAQHTSSVLASVFLYPPLDSWQKQKFIAYFMLDLQSPYHGFRPVQ